MEWQIFFNSLIIPEYLDNFVATLSFPYEISINKRNTGEVKWLNSLHFNPIFIHSCASINITYI